MGGADMIHLDIMDGHFVPNITFGPVVVKSIRGETSLPFEAHLMIERPDLYWDRFAEVGVEWITVHAEVKIPLRPLLREMEGTVKTGLAINPGTPLRAVESLLDMLDFLLIMTVNPGFAGQKFIQSAALKVKEAVALREREGYSYIVGVDGGINPDTGKIVVGYGADVLVAASAVFRGDVAENIRRLKSMGGGNGKD